MAARFTLVEPHFHDLRFEPTAIIGDDAAASEKRREESADSGKSKPKMAIQGLVVFLLMFGILWVVFSRLTEPDEE